MKKWAYPYSYHHCEGKSPAQQTALKETGYFPEIIAKKLQVGSTIQTAFAKTYKAGVKVLLAPMQVYMHTEKNWMEFMYDRSRYAYTGMY